MAFESGTALNKCGLCDNERKGFRLITSDRSEHRQPDPDNEAQFKGTEPCTKSKGLRICEICELSSRQKEVDEWGECEFLRVNPSWATLREVFTDMKRESKGANWMSRGKTYMQAYEMVRGMKGADGTPLSKRARAAALRETNRELANDFVAAMKAGDGGLFTAFGLAGARLRGAMASNDKLCAAYEEFLQDPTPENQELLERLEEEVEKAHNYQTFDDLPDQVELLKALDHDDKIAEGIRVFNLCRRKIGYCTCGMYTSSALWWRIGDRWKFLCKIQWERAMSISEDHKAGIMKIMEPLHGADASLWPQPGCGSKFVPWAHGESQVIEFYATSRGEWVAFMAARMPQIIDDEVKKNQAAFYRAQSKLSPEVIMQTLPKVYPKVYVLENCPLVSKFPVDQWVADGGPILSAAGWCTLALSIARNDMANLGGIFAAVEEFHKKQSDFPALEGGKFLALDGLRAQPRGSAASAGVDMID